MTLAAYRSEGFGRLEAVVPADRLAAVRGACEAVWAAHGHEPATVAAGPDDGVDRRYRRATVAGGRVVDRLDPVVDLDPRLAALAADPLVTEPVRSLVDGPPVLVKHKLIWKGPGVDGYGAHQDLAYLAAAGVDPQRCATVLVPLDPFDVAAGPLEVVSGSHRALLAGPDGAIDPDPDQLVGCRWTTAVLEPGDLGLLHPLVLHRSGPNRTATARRILFLTYAAGPGADQLADRLLALYQDRFKPMIDAGGTGGGAGGR